MSKSILVIDADKCSQCLFSDIDGEYCGLNEKLISREQYSEKKPDWCPLKEIPEKLDAEKARKEHPWDGKYKYLQGWNDCIDKILKEEKTHGNEQK